MFTNNNILIVDDIADNRFLLKYMLKKEGDANIFEADSGESALALLEEHTFDIALLDVNMPVMSGIELAVALRSHPEHQSIPIIFITASHFSKENIKAGYEAGAIDYLSKPIESMILVQKVRVLLTLVEQKKEIEKFNHTLTDQNQELIRLNEFKSEFLGMAAHDMKTPIATINSIAQEVMMILDNYDAEKDKESTRTCLEEIYSEGIRLSNMINDVLESERLDSGKLDLNLMSSDLDDICQEMVDALYFLAADKQIKIHFKPQSFPEILIDPMRIKEAISNLLSNAIKFSQPNTNIWVETSNDEVFKSRRISIRDEGPGFSEKDLSNAFQKFQRLSAKPTAKESSTGLGLSIVKTLVELHGGTIWIESEQGKGATFNIELPYGRDE